MVSLSPSKAQYLLEPYCPEKFKWVIDHPEPPKPAWDFGELVHGLLLGDAREVVVLDPAVHGLKADGTPASSPASTATWKAEVEKARANDAVPVHIDDHAKAVAMVERVRAHPSAGPLFEDGHAEQRLRVQDPYTGVMLSGRADWLTMIGGRVWIVDYKTAGSAHPRVFARKAADFNYHLQGAWYRALVRLLGMDDDPEVVFVVQEKDEPYPLSVVRLDPQAMRLGEIRMREAIDLYAWCQLRDEWPSYNPDIETVSLPGWAYRNISEESFA